eukprot:8895972-Alexandrium_andersonii.AAC.1
MAGRRAGAASRARALKVVVWIAKPRHHGHRPPSHLYRRTRPHDAKARQRRAVVDRKAEKFRAEVEFAHW